MVFKVGINKKFAHFGIFVLATSKPKAQIDFRKVLLQKNGSFYGNLDCGSQASKLWDKIFQSMEEAVIVAHFTIFRHSESLNEGPEQNFFWKRFSSTSVHMSMEDLMEKPESVITEKMRYSDGKKTKNWAIFWISWQRRIQGKDEKLKKTLQILSPPR